MAVADAAAQSLIHASIPAIIIIIMIAAAAPYVAQAQEVAMQAATAAEQTTAHLSAFISSLELRSHLAPVWPLLDAASQRLTPLYRQAQDFAVPLARPYIQLIHPYVGEGKKYLDKIEPAEAFYVFAGIFGGVLVLQLLLSLSALCRRRGRMLKAFTPTVFWLLISGIIHSWIEWSFVFQRTTSFTNSMNLYGAADFRYGVGKNLELEPGTAAMEAITAYLSGPLCFLLAWGIVGQKSWRWGVQIMTCTCQIYGLLWFMSHPLFLEERISSMDPFLYWVIFVGFNAPWGIVPPILLIQALRHVCSLESKAQQLEDEREKSKSSKKNKKSSASSSNGSSAQVVPMRSPSAEKKSK